LIRTAALSRFCEFWITKTIKKVKIVVPVLITSCHVSLKPKMGPVRSQARTTPAASANAIGWPAARAVQFAKREKVDLRYTVRAPVRRRHGSSDLMAACRLCVVKAVLDAGPNLSPRRGPSRAIPTCAPSARCR
jgi:hypothetical protein